MENNIKETNARDREIDLKFFFAVFRKCWYWIILAAVLCGLLAGVYSSFFIEKMYSSTVNMYVDPNGTTSSGMLSASTADALAATYPPVIRHSDTFAREVALRMAELTIEDGSAAFPTWTYETVGGEKVPNNWGRVRNVMTTGIKDDKIFYITMRSSDPKEAYALAQTAASVAPTVLNKIVGVGHVTVIGEPVLDTAADSPNVTRNAALAAIVGAVLVYAAFFLLKLLDITVYTESDLSRFGLPVLGVVPTFPTAETEKAARSGSKEVSGE